MIRSTKTTIRFANANKRKQLVTFIDEYRRVVSTFVDLLWKQDKIPTLLPKSITSQITSWLSARGLQCAGKQASGIVRGIKRKQQKREYVYSKLNQEGHHKQARKLKAIIDKVKMTKPNINEVEPELDERFVKQDWNNTTSFDGIVTLTSLGNKLKISIPVKKTSHFNRLLAGGAIKKGIRLSKTNITFMFDLSDVIKRAEGHTIGLDIGVTNVFSTSDNQLSQPDIHGHTLQIINQKLARKRKGSRAFARAQTHRTNHINWAINCLNLKDVKTLKIENIKHLRKGRKSSRYLSHFTYTEIFGKLESLCETNGVQIERINPTYTSQRCSECGWVRSSNRKGKQFRCKSCDFTLDADLNASRNIAANLRPIGREERLLHKNRKGFYWNEAGKEPIVPSAQKSDKQACNKRL
jgi:IS605 OrfB family transposase